jgi:hypothetical protein
MNRADLEKLDKDQLIALANNEYGLDVDRRFNEEKLTSLILAHAAKGDTVNKFTGFADDDGMFTVPPGGAVVEIQTNAYNPYKRPVPLGVNGRFIYAPVERPIVIAGKYLEVLRNAVREETIQKKDEHGIMRTYYNTKSSYPFSILYENKTDATRKVSV